MIRRFRNGFGIGFGFEKISMCDDNWEWSWKAIHGKVYLGWWIWVYMVRVSKKTETCPKDTIRFHYSDEACDQGES